MAKNRTSRPYPTPTRALWMPRMAFHISPPLKVSGVWVRRVHISASLSFHPESASSRILTTQLSLIKLHLLWGIASHGETQFPIFFCMAHATPMVVRSRVSTRRLTALLRQVSKNSPPNRTYTSPRIRLSRNQSNFPACNKS